MKAKKYVNGGKTTASTDPKKKTAAEGLKALGEYTSTLGYAKDGYNPRPKQKTSGVALPEKTGMDALRALGQYISTFGFATEGYNPAPKKTAKKTPTKK